MTMTHDDWMREHRLLSARVDDIRARRDELMRYSSYVPGPVLQKRERALDQLEGDALDKLAALVELDRDGAVS